MSFVELAGVFKDARKEDDSVTVMDLHRRDLSDDQLQRFEQYAAGDHLFLRYGFATS